MTSTASRIALHGGRRGGKTRGVVSRALHDSARYPGATIPIMETTTTCQAARVAWRELEDVNAKFGLGMRFHHSLFVATLPNRSEIMLVGAGTTEGWDKIRGNRYPVILVDEAGTFRPHVLEYGIHEAAEPALMDYRGSLVLAGTPAPRRQGPFAAACLDESGRWERHHLTFRDNNALPLEMAGASPAERLAAREQWFEELKAANGWTDGSPWVQREYLGQWAEDTEGLVYRLAPHNHVGVSMPDTRTGEWRYALGIDFGYDDATAFVVIAWRRGDPTVWVLESYEQPGLIPSAVAAHTERLRVRYPFSFIVGDMGGYGKGPAEEMRQSFGIPIVPAKKRGKEAHVAFLNGDLASGVIRIVETTNRDLIGDLYKLRRAEGADFAEHEADSNHLPDALLYARTHLHQNLNMGFGDRAGPERGSPEWHRERSRQLELWHVELAHRARIEDDLGAAVDMLPLE